MLFVKEKMIGIITTGRLGNQMFQFAFGKMLERKFGRKVIFVNKEKALSAKLK